MFLFKDRQTEAHNVTSCQFPITVHHPIHDLAAQPYHLAGSVWLELLGSGLTPTPISSSSGTSLIVPCETYLATSLRLHAVVRAGNSLLLEQVTQIAIDQTSSFSDDKRVAGYRSVTD